MPTEVSNHVEQQEQAKPQHSNAPHASAGSVRKALIVAAVLLLVLIVSGAATILSRRYDERVLTKQTEAAAIPSVAVVHPKAEKTDDQILLPGTLQAFEESPIYARTSGYLVKWYKDIGSRVRQGELLAKIDTPEVDQQLLQARAAREQIVAQLQLAKISADRWENLRKSDSVSQQEADQETSGYQQAKANLAASDANVRRLEQLESFKNVYAPFSGVLTRRNVDPGALINAGAGAAGSELFDMAKLDTLRVFVNVPQSYVPSVKVGMETFITFQELPGQKFKGKVARTSESIDPATRTLLTEIDVPNSDGRLLPGSFGQVHFAVPDNGNKVTIPVNTMLFREEGPRVGVVDQNGTVHLRPISIGRDFGSTLEILGGVDAKENIIVNPSDSLEDGQKVQVAQPEQQGQKPQQGAQKS
jgi:RND family efflux transporter MFP subunit